MSGKTNPKINARAIGRGNVSNDEFECLNGVTGNIQEQINNVDGGGGGVTNSTDLADWADVQADINSRLPNDGSGDMRGAINFVTDTVPFLDPTQKHQIYSDGSALVIQSVDDSATSWTNSATMKSVINDGVDTYTAEARVSSAENTAKLTYYWNADGVIRGGGFVTSDVAGFACRIIVQNDFQSIAESEIMHADANQVYFQSPDATRKHVFFNMTSVDVAPGPEAQLKVCDNNSIHLLAWWNLSTTRMASLVIGDSTSNGVRINKIGGSIYLEDPAPGITKSADFVLSSTPTAGQVGVYLGGGVNGLYVKIGSAAARSLQWISDFLFYE